MSEPLSKDEISEQLKDLEGWSLANDKIEKTFTFSNFREAVSFIVRLSFPAEEHNHHPELENVYNEVTLRLTTHDAGGRVTANDFQLARDIEEFSWV